MSTTMCHNQDAIKKHQKILRRKTYLEGAAKAKREGRSNPYAYMELEYDWELLEGRQRPHHLCRDGSI